MTAHTVRATPESCHPSYSPEHAPIVTIDPGDTVTIHEIPDVSWGIEPPTSTTAPRAKMNPCDPAGPCLCGPVAIRGAEPGMTLAVRIDQIVTSDWGWTYAGSRFLSSPRLNERLGVADEPLALLRWAIDSDRGTATSNRLHRVRARPFLGSIGLAHPRKIERPSPWRPRRTGGNIDCRLLTAGTTLLLPVETEGALLSVGDTHAAQGDGECAGTAIECMCMRVTLTPTILLRTIDTPIALTPEGLVTLAFADTLGAAVPRALNALLDILVPLLELPRAEALALTSAAANVHVTQLVNKGVGPRALLPTEFLSENKIDPAGHLGVE